MSSSDEHEVPAAFLPLEVKIIKTQNKKKMYLKLEKIVFKHFEMQEKLTKNKMKRKNASYSCWSFKRAENCKTLFWQIPADFCINE